MNLETLDWGIIAAFLGLTIFIGIYFSKKASASISDFFLSGRNLPWYVAGISMVATTFAADTPLAVTELVAKNGISGNWVWWNFLIGGLLTTYFFSRYWRKANILTEVEFIHIRYSGKPAHYLRLFKSVYLGLIINVAIISWVNLAMVSILAVFFNIPEKDAFVYVFGLCLLISVYSAVSGLWGVAINDVIQFFVAMTGSIALALFVINSTEIGGIEGLKAQIPAESLNFLPSVGSEVGKGLTVGLGSFLAFMGFQWWASWYPGAEPGGGGYIAQRMMSTRSEKDALLATLFFQFAHYCLRPWPWILVALASLALYPHLEPDESRLGYVVAMRDYLPVGWKGLILAAFLAAYMSTISTQINWGASLLTNDFYMPLTKETKEKNLVWVSRITTIILVICGAIITLYIKTISGVWEFIIECGAGLGLVLILRWYWWRINAFSEIAATLTPFVAYSFCHLVLARYNPAWGEGLLTDPRTFFFTLTATTVVWLLVTFLTPAEPKAFLQSFYNRVQPDGWWQAFRGSNRGKSMLPKFALWLVSIVLIYSGLFFSGHFILQIHSHIFWSGGIFVLSLIVFYFLFKKEYDTE